MKSKIFISHFSFIVFLLKDIRTPAEIHIKLRLSVKFKEKGNKFSQGIKLNRFLLDGKLEMKSKVF